MKLSSTKFFFAAIALVAIAFDAHANREEIVTGTNGGIPYLVVLEGEGPSNKAPGIYKRDLKNDWMLVIPGKVAILDRIGGYIHQFELAGITKRADAFAVVDGKIHLFSAESDSSKAGQASDIYIYDNQNNNNSIKVYVNKNAPSVSLPEITNGENLAYYQKIIKDPGTGKSYQVVVFSINSPNPMGSGITFSSIFDVVTENGKIQLKLVNKPVLLDWEYIDSVNLNQRIITNTQSIGFISKDLINKYSQAKTNDENPILTSWRSQLARFTANFDSELKSAVSGYGLTHLPYFDLVKNQIKIDKLPALSFQAKTSKIHVIFDPAGDKTGVYTSTNNNFSLDELKISKPLIHSEAALSGNMLTDSNNYVSKPLNGSFYFIGDKAGALHLLFINDKGMSSVQLKPLLKNSPIKDVTYFLSESTPHIFVSWKFADGTSQTEVYALKVLNNQVQVADNITLSTEFYGKDQLGQRILTVQVNGEAVLSFDNNTQNVVSRSEYRQHHKLSAPHIDVAKSLQENNVIEYYPQAADELELQPYISYKKFDARNDGARRNGFYLGKDDEPKFITEILAPPSLIKKYNIDETTFTFESKSVAVSNKAFDQADLSIVFGDDSFEKGAEKFVTYLLFSNRFTESKYVIELFETKQIPLSAIEDVHSFIVQRDKNATDSSFQYVLFFKVKSQGLIPYVVKISPPVHNSPDEDFKIELSNKSPRPLLGDDVNVSKDEIELRLKVDKNGSVYWVKTPELQFSDPDYRLVELRSGKTIDPNKETISLFSTNRKETSESHGSSWRYLTSTFSNYQNRKDTTLPINPLIGQPVSSGQFKTDMFSEFKGILDEISNPSKPARRTVLIVPDNLRDYALGYPLALYMRDTDSSRTWNAKSEKLKLYVMDKSGSKQEEVLKNLDSLRTSAQDVSVRPVLLGSISQIIQNQRPQPGDVNKPAFTIADESVSDIGTAEARSTSTNPYPHLLYMLLTEGKHIPVEQFVKNQPSYTPRFSSLLIGTEAEWNELIESGSLEDRINIKNMFEVVKLEAPSTETRQKFVLEVLSRREIQALNYRINTSSFGQNKKEPTWGTDENAKKLLAEYFVNRADQLSHDNKESELSGFIKALNNFVSELQKNTVIRSSRTIDRSTVEQVLAKVFPVVLNLDVLDESDPLKRLSKPNAAWLWQQAGYGGPLSLKQDVIKVIRSQLIPDSARSASSSFIVVGESGTGKTALFRSLFGNFLNLKEYKTTQSDEENAGSWYFILSCQLIRESFNGKSDAPGSISVDQAIDHIEKFLASANGHRGFLIFDDLHLAPGKVRDILISKMRYILENPTIPLIGGESIPTRNITIGMTLNFTNQNFLTKISPNNWNYTTDQRILASLSHNEKLYDDSLLKRFGKTILLDLHPQDAKSPQLRKALVDATKNTFSNSKVLNFINSETIDNITKQFPKADARTFTATAVANLVQLNQTKGQIIMVTPKLTMPTHQDNPLKALEDKPSSPLSGTSTEAMQKQIEDYIQNNFDIVAVEKTQRGKIELLKYMADIVRKFAFESILKSINEDARFAGNVLGQQSLGAPSARAIFDHLEHVPYFPMKELNLDPALMNAKSVTEKNQFRRILTAILTNQESQNAKLPKVANPPVANIFEEFTTGKSSFVGSRSRQHVLKDIHDKLEPIVSKLTASLMRIENIRQLPNQEEWLGRLDRNDPNINQLVGPELVQLLTEYLLEISDKELIENRAEARGETTHKLTQYDSVRLFAMVVDKAIANLPWERMTMFMMHNLEFSTGNLAHGHNPYLQHFLFESKYSALKSIDASLVTGHARAMPLFDNMGAPDPKRLNSSFSEKCEHLLAKILAE